MTALQLDPEPASVTTARRFVAGQLDALDEDVVDAAALAVSELAANAVRHARTRFTVSVACDDEEIRVEVIDHGSGRPEVHHPDPSTPSGRGLAIVERITDAWGVDPVTDGGHRIWFRLRVSPSSGAGPTARGRSHGRGGGVTSIDQRGVWSVPIGRDRGPFGPRWWGQVSPARAASSGRSTPR